MNWYIEAFRKYAQFSGRSRRREYWFFVLFNFIVALALGIVDAAIGLGFEESRMGVLSGLYTLVALIPGIAVSVRRLHDTNRSGWWLLVSLVPIVGIIILLVFYLQDSDAGPNQYGANPKGSSAPTF